MGLLAIVPLLAAACGGSSPSTPAATSHVVAGPGFRFAVPVGWTVVRSAKGVTATEHGSPAIFVSATVFPLLKPYRHALFAQAAKELDRVATQLVQSAHGTLTERTTTIVAGRKVRAYRYHASPASRPAYAARIGFVLDGSREYQLLCQAPSGAGDPDGACDLLFGSFRAAA